MFKHTHKKRGLNALSSSVLMSILVSGHAFALESKPHKVGANGATQVSSLITSSLGYGDNVFRGSTRETSSTFLHIKPEIEAVRETSEQRLSLAYEGFGAVFFDSSDDNYLSNKLSADFVRSLNAVSEFDIGAAFEDGSTVRGIDITEGSNGQVEGATDFTRKDFNLGYALGSNKIGPSIEIGYDFSDIEFDNFRDINQGRDHSMSGVSARLAYQYSVATNVFIDLLHNEFDYDQALSGSAFSLDNTEQTAQVGVKWRLTRLTSGEVKIGVTDKDFDNFINPGSFTTWNAELEWTPTARDTLSLVSFSKPFEQAGTGLFQELDQTSINWKHDFSRKLSVTSGFSVGSVEFGGAERDDDFDTLSVSLLYSPSRYAQWSINFEREEKDSNLPQFDFETNTVFVSYAISL